MSLASRVILGIMHLIGSLPIRVRIWLGRMIGRMSALLPTRARAIASLHLDLMLQEAGGSALTSRVFQNVGQSFMESLNLEPYLKDPGRYVICDQLEQGREWVASGKGVVALTAHTSNWDLLAAYFIRMGIPITTVGRQAKKAFLQPALEELRNRYGVRVIWRSDGDGVKQMIGILKKGGVVAALIDQDTKVNSAHVPFFGFPAYTPSGLAALAKRYGAIIAVPLIFREESGRYRITIEQIDGSLSVEEILARYSAILERSIREHPEQWVWFHKRWRTHPSQGILSSSRYIEYLRALKSGEAA
jgi:KDO2-lipid IV(A) lauroyltransferase